jgi:cysteine-rich repeat protein
MWVSPLGAETVPHPAYGLDSCQDLAQTRPYLMIGDDEPDNSIRVVLGGPDRASLYATHCIRGGETHPAFSFVIYQRELATYLPSEIAQDYGNVTKLSNADAARVTGPGRRTFRIRHIYSPPAGTPLTTTIWYIDTSNPWLDHRKGMGIGYGGDYNVCAATSYAACAWMSTTKGYGDRPLESWNGIFNSGSPMYGTGWDDMRRLRMDAAGVHTCGFYGSEWFYSDSRRCMNRGVSPNPGLPTYPTDYYARSIVRMGISAWRSDCGNGVIDAGEECDDGNWAGHDGCSAVCTVEPGYRCRVVAGVPASRCAHGFSCAELVSRHPHWPSGVYDLDTGVFNGNVVVRGVYCDLDPANDGGGWALVAAWDDNQRLAPSTGAYLSQSLRPNARGFTTKFADSTILNIAGSSGLSSAASTRGMWRITAWPHSEAERRGTARVLYIESDGSSLTYADTMALLGLFNALLSRRFCSAAALSQCPRDITAWPSGNMTSPTAEPFRSFDDTTAAEMADYRTENGQMLIMGSSDGVDKCFGVPVSTTRCFNLGRLANGFVNPPRVLLEVRPVVVGDTYADAVQGETCDDGNFVSGDGCSNSGTRDDGTGGAPPSTCDEDPAAAAGGVATVTMAPRRDVGSLEPTMDMLCVTLDSSPNAKVSGSFALLSQFVQPPGQPMSAMSAALRDQVFGRDGLWVHGGTPGGVPNSPHGPNNGQFHVRSHDWRAFFEPGAAYTLVQSCHKGMGPVPVDRVAIAYDVVIPFEDPAVDDNPEAGSGAARKRSRGRVFASRKAAPRPRLSQVRAPSRPGAALDDRSWLLADRRVVHTSAGVPAFDDTVPQARGARLWLPHAHVDGDDPGDSPSSSSLGASLLASADPVPGRVDVDPQGGVNGTLVFVADAADPASAGDPSISPAGALVPAASAAAASQRGSAGIVPVEPLPGAYPAHAAFTAMPDAAAVGVANGDIARLAHAPGVYGSVGTATTMMTTCAYWAKRIEPTPAAQMDEMGTEPDAFGIPGGNRGLSRRGEHARSSCAAIRAARGDSARTGLYLLETRDEQYRPHFLIAHCEMPDVSPDGSSWTLLTRFSTSAVTAPIQGYPHAVAQSYFGRRDGVMWIDGYAESVPAGADPAVDAAQATGGASPGPGSVPLGAGLGDAPSLRSASGQRFRVESLAWRDLIGDGSRAYRLRQRCTRADIASGTSDTDVSFVFTVSRQGGVGVSHGGVGEYAKPVFHQRFDMPFAAQSKTTRFSPREALGERSWLLTERIVYKDGGGPLTTSQSYRPEEVVRLVLPVDARATEFYDGLRWANICSGSLDGPTTFDSSCGIKEPHRFRLGALGIVGEDPSESNDPAVALTPNLDVSAAADTDPFMLRASAATFGVSGAPMSCSYYVRPAETDEGRATVAAAEATGGQGFSIAKLRRRPTSCAQLQELHATAVHGISDPTAALSFLPGPLLETGLYHVWPPGVPPIESEPRVVFCDMTTLGGGFMLLSSFASSAMDLSTEMTSVEFNKYFRPGTWMGSSEWAHPLTPIPDVTTGGNLLAQYGSLPWNQHIVPPEPVFSGLPGMHYDLRQWCSRNTSDEVDIVMRLTGPQAGKDHFVQFDTVSSEKYLDVDNIYYLTDTSSVTWFASAKFTTLQFPAGQPVTPPTEPIFTSCSSGGGSEVNCGGQRTGGRLLGTSGVYALDADSQSEAFDALPYLSGKDFARVFHDDGEFGMHGIDTMWCGHYVKPLARPLVTAVAPPALFLHGPANVTVYGAGLITPNTDTFVTVDGVPCQVDTTSAGNASSTPGALRCSIGMNPGFMSGVGPSRVVGVKLTYTGARSSLPLVAVPDAAPAMRVDILDVSFLVAPWTHTVSLVAGQGAVTVAGWLGFSGPFEVDTVHFVRLSPVSPAADPALTGLAVDPWTGALLVTPPASIAAPANATYNVTVSFFPMIGVRDPATVIVSMHHVIVTFAVAASPLVLSVSPSSRATCDATTAAGGGIVISGANLATSALDVVSVTIGAESCTAPVWISDAQIDCPVMPSVSAQGDVTVTSASRGAGTLPSGYTLWDAPNVTAVSPSSFLSQDSPVTLTASLVAGTTIPAGAALELVVMGTDGVTPAVTVPLAGGPIAAAIAPSPTAVTLAFGPVSLVGRPLGPSLRVVAAVAGGSACARSPWQAGGTVAITATPTTTLVSFTPAKTAINIVGAVLTVKGTLLPVNTTGSGGIVSLIVAGVANCTTSVVVTSATELSCVLPSVPAPAIGSVVMVLSTGATISTLVNFEFFDPAAASVLPTVTAIVPARGPPSGGTAVTILGTSLGSGPASITSAALAGIPCTLVLWVSATEITCTSGAAPGPLALGVVTLIVAVGTNGTAPFVPATVGAGVTYSYAHPAPVITSISPTGASAAAAGTVVTVRGAFFPETTSLQIGSILVCATPLALSADLASGTCTITVSFPDSYVGTTVPVTASGASGGISNPGVLFFVAPEYTKLIRVDAYADRRITSEDGTLFDSIELELDDSVAIAIAVTLEVTDDTEAALDAKVVVLTPQRKTASVTVRGVRDDLRDGNVTYEVVLNTTSANPDYTALPLPRIGFVNMDLPPVLVVIVPEVSSLLGRIVTLFGANFDASTIVTVGGNVVDGNTTRVLRSTPATAQRRSKRAASISIPRDGGFTSDDSDDHLHVTQATATVPADAWPAGTDSALVFMAPVQNEEGYYSVSVENVDSTTRGSGGNMLYYTNDCPEPNQFGEGLDCGPCPEGGICPGGYRIRPLPGYWNPGEDSGFVKRCNPPQSCTGCVGVGVDVCYSTGTAAPCAFGYEGEFCGDCIDDPRHYRAQGSGPCIPCPHDREIYPTIVGFVVLWAVISIAGVWVESRETFAHFVSVMVAIQEVVGVGALLTNYLPDWCLKMYDVLYLFAGDVRFVRPSCTGEFDVFSEFYISIAFFVVIGIPMHLGCLITGKVAAARATRQVDAAYGAGRRVFYRNRQVRLFHAHAVLVYLAVSARCLSMITCVPVAGEYRLAIQMSTRCYAGPHVIATSVAAVVLAGFTLGWPAWNIFLSRARNDRLYGDADFAEKFDYTMEAFKPRLRDAWLSEVVVAVAIAVCQTALISHPNAQLGVAGGLFALLVVATLILRPYDRPYENIVMAMLYTAHLLAVTLIYVIGAGHVTDASTIDAIVYTIVALTGLVFCTFVSIAFYAVFSPPPPVREHMVEAVEKRKLKRRSGREYEDHVPDDAGLDGEFEYAFEDGPGASGRRGGVSFAADPATSVWNGFLDLFGLNGQDEADLLVTSRGGGGGNGGGLPRIRRAAISSGTGTAAAAGAAAAGAVVVAGAAATRDAPGQERVLSGPPPEPPTVPLQDMVPSVVRVPYEPMNLGDRLAKMLFLAADPSAPRAVPSEWGSAVYDDAVIDRTADLMTSVQDALDSTCKTEHIGRGVDAAAGPGSYTRLEVVRVEQVRSAELWEAHEFSASSMHKRLTRAEVAAPKLVGVATDTCAAGLALETPLAVAVNEHILFHGTTPNLVPIVAKTGFEPRVAQQGMFGTGVYFAENSSKADEYARPGPDGVCTMFIARVVLGDPFVALTALPLRRPPCIMGHAGQACAHRRFDSVLAETTATMPEAVLTRHREFVVFDGAAAYPSLVVHYRRRSSSS